MFVVVKAIFYKEEIVIFGNILEFCCTSSTAFYFRATSIKTSSMKNEQIYAASAFQNFLCDENCVVYFFFKIC